jgi:hypothetical protein
MQSTIRMFFVLSLVTISAYGQTQYSVELSASKPFIPGNTVVIVPLIPSIGGVSQTLDLTESFKTQTGLSLNVGIDIPIRQRFDLFTGLGFSLRSFQREINLTQNNSSSVNIGTIGSSTGMPIGGYFGPQPGDVVFIDSGFNDSFVVTSPNEGKTNIWYLSIPVKVQYSIIPDQFRIGLGVTNYLIAYSTQIRSYVGATRPVTITEYKDTSSNGLNNYQLNGTISPEYRVFKNVWVQASYGHGFLSVFDKPQTQMHGYPVVDKGKAKYRAVEVGLKYVLF